MLQTQSILLFIAMLMCIMSSTYALTCPDVPDIRFYNCYYWGGRNEKWCYIHGLAAGPNFVFVGYADPDTSTSWTTNDPYYRVYVPGDYHERGMVIRTDDGLNKPIKFILRQWCWDGATQVVRDIVYTSGTGFTFCAIGNCDAGWDHPDHTIN